ncbi:MAG: substrate-binding domain-containing protein [Phycisphaeraceae bacterium]
MPNIPNDPHNPQTPPRRITILVSGWAAYGRGIIEGVWQYAQRNGPWMLSLDPGEPDERTQMPTGSPGDGVIASVHTAKLAEQLKKSGVPVVNVASTLLDNASFPRVQSDTQEVVRHAIAHLKSKGLKHIAFCGEPHREFIDHWSEAFVQEMAAQDIEPILYAPRRKLSYKTPIETHQRELRHWLEQLPKPVGVIGWATGICRYMAMGCTIANIRVPDEVAIISLETEDLLGRAISPPISGIDIPVEEIGFKAAAMLDKLLRGEVLEEEQVLLQPLGVTSRQSTDVLMVEDAEIREALRYIRENAIYGIDVRDILKEVPIARRTMERKFKAFLGHTPAEEIRQIKLEKVRELLGATNMAIPEIAEACGFNYVEHMIPVFKKKFGATPAAYRRRIQSPPR